MRKFRFVRLGSYVAGSTLLLFSEGLYDLAFAIYAYQISGKASVGAITYALGYLSEILVSFAGGGFLDRFPKFAVYSVTIGLKIAVFVSLFAWGSTRGLSEASVWFFAFTIDAIHHFSKLNNAMAVADLFDGAERAKAHGHLAAIQGASRVAGPLIGTAIVGRFGSIHGLLFCAAFQASSLAFFWIAFRGSPRAEARPPEGTAVLGTWRALQEVSRSVFWRQYFGLDALTTLVSGTAVLLTVPLMKRAFDVTDSQLGQFFAAGALGAVLGGFLLGRLIERVPFRRWMASSLALQGALLIGVVHAPSLWWAAAAKFGLDLSMTAYFRSSALYLQSHAPPERRAAYYCGADAVSRSLGLVGVIASGFAFDRFGPSGVYMGLGASLLVIAFGWSRLPANTFGSNLSVSGN